MGIRRPPAVAGSEEGSSRAPQFDAVPPPARLCLLLPSPPCAALASKSGFFISVQLPLRLPPAQAQKDADAVDKVMKELDENGDGEVDFQEYVVLVAALTVACNNFFWENS